MIMLRIELRYNPYFVTTQFVINGNIPNEDSPFAKLSAKMRLQQWIDRFYPMLLEHYPKDSNSVEIDFLWQNS